MSEPITRLVALGASNLSLGMASLLAAGRSAFGPGLEILAAPGYGRSYGERSSIPFRALPGILECGLWQALNALPRAPTRALITDVGNDILYDVPPVRILEWVRATIDRLSAHTSDLVMTNLPVESIRRLSKARFLFFRSIFFLPCRLSRDEALARVEQVNDGLLRLADERSVRLAPLAPSWYGLDPIHIQPRCWAAAWGHIVLGEPGSPGPETFSPAEWVRLHTLPPERRWLAGLEQETPQSGRPLKRGARLWLY